MRLVLNGPAATAENGVDLLAGFFFGCHTKVDLAHHAWERDAILLHSKNTSNVNLILCSSRRWYDIGGLGCGCAPTFFCTSDSDSGIVGGMTTEDQSKVSAAASGALALQFGGSTAIHPESYRGRDRRGHKERSGGGNRAHRARLQRRGAEEAQNTHFAKRTHQLTCLFTRGYRGRHQRPAGSFAAKTTSRRLVGLSFGSRTQNGRENGVENVPSGYVHGRGPALNPSGFAPYNPATAQIEEKGKMT